MCKGENIMTNIQVTYAAQTITSIEVAEMVGREHKNVMQDIRKISSDLGGAENSAYPLLQRNNVYSSTE